MPRNKSLYIVVPIELTNYDNLIRFKYKWFEKISDASMSQVGQIPMKFINTKRGTFVGLDLIECGPAQTLKIEKFFEKSSKEFLGIEN